MEISVTAKYFRWKSYLGILVIFFCSLHIITMAETYYATPTLDTPCPEKRVPCMTLSQYAEKPSSYFSSYMTINLLPGNHTLNRTLNLVGLNHVQLVLYIFNKPIRLLQEVHALVECSKEAHFNFKDVDTVIIRGLKAIGCGPSKFISLKNFTFEDSNMFGNGNNAGGIYIQDVIKVLISGCWFMHNQFSTDSERGAIVSIKNEFMIIKESFFLQ